MNQLQNSYASADRSIDSNKHHTIITNKRNKLNRSKYIDDSPSNTIPYNKSCGQCVMIASLYHDLIQYNPHSNITNEQQLKSIAQLYHTNNQMILGM